MADVSAESQKQRYREFIDLLPLTMALAGLPLAEGGRYYTEEQIEARAYSVKHAWKIARRVVRESVQPK